jgi:uncharacterized repeat protein (TIGR03803 family)
MEQGMRCNLHRFAVLAALAVFGSLSTTGTSAQTPVSTFTTLHSFNGKDGGSNPSSTLVPGPDGLFYGVVGGGKYGYGLAYSLSPMGEFDVLYAFKGTSDGSYPNGLLLHNGIFYGTTSQGADGFGTAFTLTPAGKLKTFYTFTGADGGQPGGFGFFSDGAFVATAGIGGNLPYGVVFSLTPAGQATVLYNFTDSTDESYPIAVILGSDGNYYGTTLGNAAFNAGSGEAGTIWQLTPGGTLTTLHSFGWGDGAQPLSAPVEGPDGNFYGTTAAGGASGEGVVYRITTAGEYSVLYSFTGGADGGSPRAGLLVSKNGNLYGSTYTGGGSGWGTLFEVTTAGALTTIYTFTNGTDGGSVGATLREATTGTFYGVAQTGGRFGFGTAFKFAIH